MPNDDIGEREEKLLHDLDGVLPGDIDRRQFMYGTLGAIGSSMFAGCLGGGGGGDGDGDTATPTPTEASPDEGMGFSSDMEATFTTPWKKEPTWGYAHVAELEGYWEDAGVPNVKGVKGNGSDDESRNIGTGEKEMGITSFTTAISQIPGGEDTENLDLKMVALARGHPLLAFWYRKDMMDSKTDLEGKDILLATGFAEATWPVYLQLAGNPQDVTLNPIQEGSGPALVQKGEFQGVWGSIDTVPQYQDQVDAEIEVVPLSSFGPFYGFATWVNGSWYENEASPEYVSAVLTGYFKALKWGMINQEAYLDLLVEEIQPNLAAQDRSDLVSQHAVAISHTVTDEMKDKGLGYFTEEGAKFGLDNAGPALLDDPSILPSAGDLVITEPWENSEKQTFSDDEWATLEENAGDFWSYFH